ncbi:MAG: hypothetical protein KAT65_00855, partial [Methanophagales archaeon]|nr:hypothetical protein [Methanophagales archaeon]
EFSSKISIPLSFTAECAENAEALEKPSEDCNALVLNSAPSAISAVINHCFFRQCRPAWHISMVLKRIGKVK